MAKSGPHKLRKPAAPRAEFMNFIKNWRIYREMTVEELSEEADMSTGNLSALENRRQGHSSAGLSKLAKALKTTPDALLSVDPLSEGVGDFWPLWDRATKRDRELLTEMAGRLVQQAGSPKK